LWKERSEADEGKVLKKKSSAAATPNERISEFIGVAGGYEALRVVIGVTGILEADGAVSTSITSRSLVKSITSSSELFDASEAIEVRNLFRLVCGSFSRCLLRPRVLI
jgi:hypothetical protein